MADHFAFGIGGSCFSLTAALLHLLRSLGWPAVPLLADRRYGQNTHCALVVWIEDRPHLVDPGYLIVDPIPLDLKRSTQVATAFNELILSPHADGNKIVLASFKYAGQKIHLGDGVYAGMVARYKHGCYQPFEWTFPDFCDGRYDDELAVVRRTYLQQLRELNRQENP